MRKTHRLLILAVGLAVASSLASGYYNWIFFASRSGNFNPIPAKFQLNQLTNNTVSFFISNQPPAAMVPGDSFASLVSQIQAAAAVWNQVPTSAVRLSFGGMETVGATAQNTPGIDVIFDDDMPPGLLARTRISTPADVSFIANEPSLGVPISRSTVQLRSDLTVYQQASYADSVFLTIAHEFGHALGLQHSLTSGLMATPATSATTKAAPLSADDVAGISMLYPAGGYANQVGSITGAVLQGGTGVNLASVVALCASGCPSGIAISGLTNPDGTFNIGGVPPGQYYVYAHPLPPPAQGEAYPDNIIPPVDVQQDTFPANTQMDTQFFSPSGGTREWTQAGVISVSAGGTTANINFPNMQKRSGPAIYALQTYYYPGQIPLPSPWVPAGSRFYLVMAAPGLTSNGNLTPGLGVSVVGSAAYTEGNTLAYWAPSNGFVGAKVVMDTSSIGGTTPGALAVTVPNDLYILPQAFTVVANPAPAITSVSATGATDAYGDPVVKVSGANLSTSTQVVFDGAPGAVQAANSDGSLTVAAPPGAANYTASVEALSGDGQTSLQAQGSLQEPGITLTPTLFTYSGPANPAIKVNYGVLRPGTDSEVDIIGTNTNFIAGQVSIGFGNSDVVVRRVWVLNGQRILLNVTVAPQAQPGPVELTVASGLQLETLSAILQVQTASNAMGLRVPILNAATGLDGVPAGGNALINTMGLPQNLAGWTLTVDGVKTNLPQQMIGSTLIVPIPGPTALGAAIVELSDASGNLISVVVMQIDAPPPVILGVVNTIGVPISSGNPARPGDTLTVTVTGLADPTSTIVPAVSNVSINLATPGSVGATQSLSALMPGSQPGMTQIQFTLGQNAPYGPQQQLTVGLGTRISAFVPIAIVPK